MLMPFHSLREKKKRQRRKEEGPSIDRRSKFFSLDDHYAQLLEGNYACETYLLWWIAIKAVCWLSLKVNETRKITQYDKWLKSVTYLETWWRKWSLFLVESNKFWKNREATENTYLLSLKNEGAVNILFLGERERRKEERIKSNDMRVMIDKCTKYEKQDIKLSGKHGRSK